MNFSRLTAIALRGVVLLVLVGGLWRVSTAQRSIGATVPQQPVAAASQYWRLGVTVEESPISYERLIGRLASNVMAVRPAKTNDVFFVFPASSTAATVQLAQTMIVTRTGSIDTPVTLSWEIRGLDGTLVRTISTASLDLKTAATQTWYAAALDSSANATVIAAGQMLVVHVQSADLSSKLDIRLIFEVGVQ